MGSDGRRAVVIGAGLGGLAAAVGLRRVGWHVTVLERAPSPSDGGAGIALMSNALRALAELGLGETVRTGGATQGPAGIRTPSGRWLTRVDSAALEKHLGTVIVVLHRGHLYELLRAPLPEGCVRTEAPVTVVTPGDPDGAPAQVTCGSGQGELEADLIVGADGVNSTTRSLLWPGHPGPAYCGATAWRGVTGTPVQPVAGETWGRGANFGVFPLQDGRLYWFATRTLPEGVRYANPLDEARRQFGGWHPPIPAVLRATGPETVLHHDMYELATPLTRYRRGRVVLLGDSAHAMAPNLGQGACQALEDAVELAAAVATEPNLNTALTRYDRQRRPRTQSIVRAAHRTAHLGPQLTSRAGVLLRNTAARLTPPRLGLRPLLHLVDWHPSPLPPAAGTKESQDPP